MFARLHCHITYANVVATIALFLALGTGGVFAASKLKNNSVTSKKIKDGQVANVDLGADAVTGPKVGDNSLTGADVVGLTGADVVGSSLQGVNASAVGGLQVRKIRFDIPYDDVSPAVEVLNLGGLRITAVCRTFGNQLDVKAFTTKNAASIFFNATRLVSDLPGSPDDSNTNAVRDIDGDSNDQGGFSTNETFEVDDFIPGGGAGVGTLHYEAPDGSVVVVELAFSDTSGASPNCTMTGVAIGA
jgi:hypothetical protein